MERKKSKGMELKKSREMQPLLHEQEEEREEEQPNLIEDTEILYSPSQASKNKISEENLSTSKDIQAISLDQLPKEKLISKKQFSHSKNLRKTEIKGELEYTKTNDVDDISQFKLNKDIKTRKLVQIERQDVKETNRLKVGAKISIFTKTLSSFLSAEGFSSAICRLLESSGEDDLVANFPNCIFEVYAVVDDIKSYWHEQSKQKRQIETPIVICYACKGKCFDFYFHCDKTAEFNLCQTCFSEEAFPVDVFPSDFDIVSTLSNPSTSFHTKKGEIVQYGGAILLRNVRSGKFLSVCASTDNENNKLIMKLKLRNNPLSSENWFIITPRFRIQTLGDKVYIEDEIFLLNAKWQRYVQSTSTVNSEIVLSYAPSSWKIIPFSTTTKSKDVICGGSDLRLVHIETDSWFNCDLIDLHSQNEKTLFFKKNLKSETKIYRNKESNGIWQIVLLKPKYGGKELTFNDTPFLLFHLATGAYLAVEEKDGKYYPLCTMDHKSPAAIFCFKCASQEKQNTNEVTYNSQVYLCNVATSATLAVNSECIDVSTIQSYTTLILHGIHFEKDIKFEDALILRQPHPSESIHLIRVREVAKILLQFREKIISEQPISKFYVKQIINLVEGVLCFITLSKDKDPITIAGLPIRPRQSLLRDQSLIDILFSVLSAFNEQSPMRIPNYENLCIVIYRLLGKATENYIKNSFILSEKLPFFMTQVKIDNEKIISPILVTLDGIFKDNEIILHDSSKINPFLTLCLELAMKKKNRRFIDLVSNFCLCNNLPLEKNQIFIFNHILENRTSHLPNITYNPETNQASVITKNRKIPLEQFCIEGGNEFSYYMAILSLISKCCTGRNYSVIERVPHLNINIEFIFGCIMNEILPTNLRALYCDLLITSLLDRSPHIPIINFQQHIRLYSELTEKITTSQSNYTLSQEDLKNQQVWEKLNGYAIRVLTNPKVHELDLTYQLVLILKNLITFSLIKESHIETNIDALHIFLNHSRKFEETKVLLDTRISISEVLLMLQDRIVTSLIANYFIPFEPKLNLDEHALDLIEKEIHSPEVGKSLGVFHNILSEMGWTKKLEDDVDLTMKINNLLYLTLPAHTQLNLNAYSLLSRYLCPHRYLKLYLSNMEILFSKEEELFFNYIKEYLAEFSKALSTGTNLLANIYRQAKLLEIFPKLIDLCFKDDRTKGKVHTENQNLFRKLQVYKVVIKILEIRPESDHLKFIELQKKAIEFLERFCKDNSENQVILWKYFDFFLKIKAYPLLTFIAKDNIIISAQINDDTINNIRKAVVAERSPGIISLLKRFVLINEKPISQNQNLVIKLLFENQASLVMFTTKEGKAQFEELLSNEENIQNSESLLWYHRELIDLLSFCATNNHEVRILCSTILSLSEILEFLNLLIKVNIRLSIPYLNLITQVFLPFFKERKSQKGYENPFRHHFLQFIEIISINADRIIHEKAIDFQKYFFNRIIPLISNFCDDYSDLIKSSIKDTNLKEKLTPIIKKLIDSLLDARTLAEKEKLFTIHKEASFACFHQVWEASKELFPDPEAVINNNKPSPQDREIRRLQTIKTLINQGNLVKPQEFKRDSDEEKHKEKREEFVKNFKTFTKLIANEARLTAEMDSMLTWLTIQGELRTKQLRKLIKLLGYPQTSNLLKEDDFVTFLKILYHIVKRGEESNTDKQVIITNEDEDVVKILLELGAIKIIIRSISSDNTRILKNNLRFANSLLRINPIETQTTLLDDFEILNKDRTSFFSNLNKKLKNFIQQEKQMKLFSSEEQKLLQKVQIKPQIIEELLLFIQLLCEGQHHIKDLPNHHLQDLLRIQKETDSSFNIINETFNYFSAIEKRFDYQQFFQEPDHWFPASKIILQAIRTLTETIQGPNEENQIFLIDTNRFFNPINNIFKSASIDAMLKAPQSKAVEQMIKILDNLVTLLLAFLSGRTEQDIPKYVIQALDLKNLIRDLKEIDQLMSHYQTHRLKSHRHKNKWNPETVTLLVDLEKSYCILGKSIIDWEGTVEEEVELGLLCEKLDDYIASIEIVRNEMLERVSYFSKF